ncbi:Bacterial non-heme ferritin [bioreactor metagenome]|jgi:ferritin|uniref:Bacterial non-heme ferritin n=1 Tax=bioreactor metagenome TaxID=1076179 RepID=A0A644XQC5_9ZZZZ|nr:ferritin [Sphaerochaeta sp.]
MLAQPIADLINEQVNKEFYSAYLYLDMANFYAGKGLLGYENWFKVQAQEEMSHAMLFRQYLLNNGYAVTLSAIADPTKEYENLKQPLVEALKHEEYVTASINTIYEEASKAKDYRTLEFLNWFIKEQGEEEMNAQENIQKFEVFGSDSKGLYMLNQELASRVFSPPSLVI